MNSVHDIANLRKIIESGQIVLVHATLTKEQGTRVSVIGCFSPIVPEEVFYIFNSRTNSYRSEPSSLLDLLTAFTAMGLEASYLDERDTKIKTEAIASALFWTKTTSETEFFINLFNPDDPPKSIPGYIPMLLDFVSCVPDGLVDVLKMMHDDFAQEDKEQTKESPVIQAPPQQEESFRLAVFMDPPYREATPTSNVLPVFKYEMKEDKPC